MTSLVNIYLFRKPLEGTVAENALKWGTGSLNIDATRIQSGPSVGGSVSGVGALSHYDGWRKDKPKEIDRSMPNGRWPANVILQHKPGCYQDGTREVKTAGWKDTDLPPDEETGSTNNFGASGMTGRHYGEDGKEVVPNWICEEGCPVADLDDQSGILKSGAMNSIAKGSQYTTYGAMYERLVQNPASEGGASRFFHQVQSYQELVDYLALMLSTPDESAEYTEDLTSFLEGREANTVSGLVLWGPLTSVGCLIEALKPGAHLCVIASDDCPTGHRDAITLEDAGLEVRDCILWVRGAGRYHYVAKAGRSEREAGCGHLAARSGAEAVNRTEGTAGLNNPRAGAGRTAKKVKNFHPTVKPINIMERLLADVPKDAIVMDPFMGSGTTAIACTNTGHSFVGVEMDPDYFAIADARVRHWDRKEFGWLGAKIESDLDEEEGEVVETGGLDDFLMG